MADDSLPLSEERIEIGKRLRHTGTVRVETVTREQTVPVEADLRVEEVEIRRVPVDRVVSGPVPDRRDGDTLIVSVLEEEVVVEKRLRVVEEIHIRHVGRTRHLRRLVNRRRQEAEVRREQP